MRNRTDTRQPTIPSPKRRHHPSPVEIVATINGVTAGIGGTYVLTSSTLITVLAGALAFATAALHFIHNR